MQSIYLYAIESNKEFSASIRYTESTKGFRVHTKAVISYLLPIFFLQTNHQLPTLENIPKFCFKLYFFYWKISRDGIWPHSYTTQASHHKDNCKQKGGGEEEERRKKKKNNSWWRASYYTTFS